MYYSVSEWALSSNRPTRARFCSATYSPLWKIIRLRSLRFVIHSAVITIWSFGCNQKLLHCNDLFTFFLKGILHNECGFFKNWFLIGFEKLTKLIVKCIQPLFNKLLYIKAITNKKDSLWSCGMNVSWFQSKMKITLFFIYVQYGTVYLCWSIMKSFIPVNGFYFISSYILCFYWYNFRKENTLVRESMNDITISCSLLAYKIFWFIKLFWLGEKFYCHLLYGATASRKIFGVLWIFLFVRCY